MQKRVRWAVGVCLVLTAAALGAPDNSWASYYRSYAEVQKYRTDKNWNWVRAELEVHNGIISSADAEAGRFIAEVLWAYTELGSGTGEDAEWVEAGYTRGWSGGDGNPYNNDILTLYWVDRKYIESPDYRYVYQEWRITSPSIGAEDTPRVVLKWLSGSGPDADWGIYINGVKKGTSHSQPHNHAHFLACGLESSASSGVLGTAADHINDMNMAKSQDGGSTIGGWQGDGLTEDVTGAYAHGHWKDGEEGYEWMNYRNW